MIHLKLTIMALLWAGGFIAGKIVSDQAGVFTISFLRFFLATSVMSIIVLNRRDRTAMNFKLFGYVVCAAFIGVFCYNYLFFSGIRWVDAGRAAVILSTVPIIVAVVSYFVLKEKRVFLKLFGILFSLLGAWVVITKGKIDGAFMQTLGRGEIYLIISVFCAAALILLSKRILNSLSPMVTLAYISAMGAAFLLGPALLEVFRQPVNQYSMKFLVGILYMGIGQSVIASMFYYEAIKLVGPAKTSQYMNLIPVFAVLLSVIFLGEQLTMSLFIGGGLVTTGLYLTNIAA